MTLTHCPECQSEIVLQSPPGSAGPVRYYCQVCEKPVLVSLMQESAAPRILVVDDLSTVRALVAEILEEAGFQVETAADGDEALVRMRDCGPDLVLLDLILPGKSGFDILEEMRAMGIHAPPVLVMSGRVHEPEEIRRASSLGAAGFIPKSTLRETLVFRIQSALHAPSTARTA